MSVKKAIVSGAFGERYLKMAEVTYPTMASYAKSVGADFVPLKERRYPQATAHWEKLQLHGVLEQYDRVIWFDSDVVVRPGAQNLFDMVEEETFGAWDEAPSKSWDYAEFIDQWSKRTGVPTAYPGIHLNTGVIVFSKLHRPLFEDPPAFPTDHHVQMLWDQGWINYRLAVLGLRWMNIGHWFNHMFIAPYGYRLQSEIVHYCGTQIKGKGYSPDIPPGRTEVDLMKMDLERWPYYKSSLSSSLNSLRGVLEFARLPGLASGPDGRYMFMYEYIKAARPQTIAVVGASPDGLRCMAADPNVRLITSDDKSACPIDILYLCGGDDYDTVVDKYKVFSGSIRPGGIVFVDEIHRNRAMERFWKELPEPKHEANFLHYKNGFGIALKA